MPDIVVSTDHHILFWSSYQVEYDGQGTQHVGVGGELRALFWWGNLKERGHLEDLGLNGKTIRDWLKKLSGRASSGLG